MSLEKLMLLRQEADNCQRCKLSKRRQRVVFGVGQTDSPDLMFVGEAPGKDEDTQGEPFVGRSGQILNRWIERLGYKRDQVFITNTVLCRPVIGVDRNRQPEFEEIEQCGRFLVGQLREVKPLLVVAVGKVAAITLTSRQLLMREFRQRVWQCGRFPMRTIYHPSYILRNAAEEAVVWEDLKLITQTLNEIKAYNAAQNGAA